MELPKVMRKSVLIFLSFVNCTNRNKAMEPENIPLGAYMHINLAFALVNPKTFRMDAMDADTARMYKRVTKLNERQPGLKVWICQ
jgi:GH18 family chitinase